MFVCGKNENQESDTTQEKRKNKDDKEVEVEEVKLEEIKEVELDHTLSAETTVVRNVLPRGAETSVRCEVRRLCVDCGGEGGLPTSKSPFSNHDVGQKN